MLQNKLPDATTRKTDFAAALIEAYLIRYVYTVNIRKRIGISLNNLEILFYTGYRYEKRKKNENFYF